MQARRLSADSRDNRRIVARLGDRLENDAIVVWNTRMSTRVLPQKDSETVHRIAKTFKRVLPTINDFNANFIDQRDKQIELARE